MTLNYVCTLMSHFRSRGPAVLASTFCAVALIASAPSAYAAEPAASAAFEIQAGPLQSALLTFASRAGISLQVDPKLIQNLKTEGLHGRYAPMDGLRELLRNTGLEVRPVGTGAFSIDAKPATPANPPTPKTSRTTDPAAVTSVVAGAETELAKIYITGSAEPPTTLVRRSTSTTRTDTPLSELPQTLTIINQAVLERQQAKSIADAVTNASSVSIAPDSSTGHTAVYIRGYPAAVMVDGVADRSNQTASTSSGLNTPVIAVDSVEVLKGADAMLAGATSSTGPGGQVNLTLKKPRAERIRTVMVEVGNFGQREVSADIGDGLFQGDNWSYRVIGSTRRDQGNEGGYRGDFDRFLSAGLGYKDESTDLSVTYSTRGSRVAPTSFTYIDMATDKPAPVLRPAGTVNDFMRSDGWAIGIDLVQKLGDGWSVTAKYRRDVGHGSNAFYTYSLDTTDSSLLDFKPSVGADRSASNSIDLSVTGEVQTGPITHKLMAGGSSSHLFAVSGFSFDWMDVIGDRNVERPELALTNLFNSTSRITDSNVFVQDQMKYGDLSVMLALSRANERAVSAYEGVPGETDNGGQSSSNPSLGVSYKLDPIVSIYGNLKRGFQPQAGAKLATGEPAPPMSFKSADVGTRFFLLDETLMLNFATFRNKVHNQLTFGRGAFVVVPGYTSKGIEAEANGRLMTGLNGLLSYNYMKVDQLTLGDKLMPREHYKLGLTYQLQGTDWNAWSVGGTVTGRSGYQSNVLSSRQHSVWMKAQNSLDLNIGYKRKDLDVLLGVKNVTNKTLYGEFAADVVSVMPRRTLTLTTRYDF